MVAVIGRPGRDSGGLPADFLHQFLAQQIRNDDETLQLDGPKLLGAGQTVPGFRDREARPLPDFLGLMVKEAPFLYPSSLPFFLGACAIGRSQGETMRTHP